MNSCRTEAMAEGRRHAVPVLFARGTHYEVGYDVGRTFGAVIASFLAGSDRLREFERCADTAVGHAAYAATLDNVSHRTPYYVNELRGVADGAGVPFRKLFLLHMDDIIETIEDHTDSKDLVTAHAVGCSSVGILRPGVATLGHTEDAFADTLNHWYILSAHIVPSDDDRRRGAREERFTSLCYAGQLPGYTMGYTAAGLVFSINTLSPLRLRPGRTPRTFLTRAMLAAHDFEEARRLLLDEGLGAGNGCSINMLWTDGDVGSTALYNVEVAPATNDEPRSLLDVRSYPSASGTATQQLIHCNRYERLRVEEVRGPIIASSAARLEVIRSKPAPTTRNHIATILSDTTGPEFRVFETRTDARVVTIAAGIFDLEARSWSLYIDKPAESEPVAVLPLQFAPLASPPTVIQLIK